ncbi:MAG TPA: hypothetical protein VMN04_01120 [Thermoanaerobaculia bacterium]|nr:hypothetical protein [Thermoanaerobaculia bacterium]
MKRSEADEDEHSPYLFCSQCEQMYERILIQECPYCEKKFCRSCAVRSGSQSFCGKACAKNWFFADADEEGEDADARRETDKGDS